MGNTLNRSIIFNHAISWFVPLILIGGGMLYYSLINHFGFLLIVLTNNIKHGILHGIFLFS